MSRITVLHENSAWVEPLRTAFAELGLPYDEWFLDQGTIAFDRAPPGGVFYNRMSASSHTRGHRYAPELTRGVLTWLEAHDRRVVNTSRALALELDKLGQYAALGRAGLRTPRTVAAVGREQTLAAARAFGPGPWILKPNRGGKGLGVRLFHALNEIAAYLDGPGAAEEAPVDGVWLIQDYIRPQAPFITRCEFVGGRFLYAVRVDTRDGFELCPAAFRHPITARYQRFLARNGIEIAGIEFITDTDGEIYSYDVNTNTNYNAQAEADAQVTVTGMRAVAAFLGEELAKQQYKNDGGRRDLFDDAALAAAQ
jgi:glutathione synthase/RimK-type ligase-like ATP-grasp enzyme